MTVGHHHGDLARLPGMGKSIHRGVAHRQLVGKLIMGMAIGTLQVTVYPYTAECVPVRCRGSVMMIGRVWYVER
jgi:hypothetical protein